MATNKPPENAYADEPVSIVLDPVTRSARARQRGGWNRLSDDQRSRVVELEDFVEHREHLDAIIDQAVVDLRVSGVSWAQIGLALRVTGEAARQRYGMAALVRASGGTFPPEVKS